MKIDDFLIIRDEKNKFQLVQILNLSKTGIRVVYEKNRNDDEKRIESDISAETVVVNLGSKPLPGTVYGCNIEPYCYSVNSKWGTIHFYRELEKKEIKQLRLSMKDAYLTLEKKNLIDFLPIELEVRPAKGKYDGSYHYHSNNEILDKMLLKPKGFDKAYLTELLYHESGHGIWFNMVPNHIKASWIEMYHTYVTLANVKTKQIISLGKSLSRLSSISEFASSLEEEENILLEACIGYISDTHYLKRRDIDILLEARKSIKQYWPTSPMQLADIETPLGEYAGKNVDEFFAEAMRLYLSGKILPKNIKNLLSDTLSKLRR